MKKLLPFVLIATLILACKKNNDNPNAVNSTDRNFLIQTYQVSQTEIRLARLAAGKASGPTVQNFGQQLGTGYENLQSDLRAVAGKINVPLPDSFSVSSQSLSGLNTFSGYSFDTAYLRGRVQSQLSLFNSFQNEMDRGNNTYVRYYFLNKYIDKIRTYYFEADSLLRKS